MAMEMAVRSMETAETAMETDGDGSGGTSPSRQGAGTDNFVPRIRRRWRRSCGTLSRNLPIVLGFSVGRLFIGEEASSEVDQVHLTMWRCGPGGAPPHGEPALCPPSGSRLVFVLHQGKIEVSVFVSSNSENIFCVAFLKHKTAEKRELALWHLVNRLVLENA
jgi:hypothetical protein